MRAEWRRRLCVLALLQGQNHGYSTAFAVGSVRCDRSTQRSDDCNSTTTFGFPIGKVGHVHMFRLKARAGIVHGQLQRLIFPMKFGAEWARSIPLDVSDQLADDLLDHMHVALGFHGIRDVRVDSRPQAL